MLGKQNGGGGGRERKGKKKGGRGAVEVREKGKPLPAVPHTNDLGGKEVD